MPSHIGNRVQFTSSPIYNSNRGYVFFKLELYRKALKDFDQALQLDGACLRAYLRKGLTLYAMGKVIDARKVWKDAIGIPGDIEILLEIYSLLNQGWFLCL